MPVFPILLTAAYQAINGKIRGYLSQFNRSLWILSAGLFVSTLGFSVSIPFIAIYFHSQLGLSLSQIGLFFGALAVVRAFFQFSGGELSDYVERRVLLIYSQIFRAGVFLFITLAIYANWGFWAIGIGFLVSSIFGSLFQPIANAMVADILPAEVQLDGYAVARSTGNLGWALGPMYGGVVLDHFPHSPALAWIIISSLATLSGIGYLVFTRTLPEVFNGRGGKR